MFRGIGQSTGDIFNQFGQEPTGGPNLEILPTMQPAGVAPGFTTPWDNPISLNYPQGAGAPIPTYINVTPSVFGSTSSSTASMLPLIIVGGGVLFMLLSKKRR